MRCNSPFSALALSALRSDTCSRSRPTGFTTKSMRAGAHRRHHIVDAAMGGLHDDGDVEAGVADFCQHAHAVEAGHHQIEHDGVDGCASGAVSAAMAASPLSTTSAS